MNILLTGATGYIGKRLLPVLVQQGHHVICCVRDTNRFNPPSSLLPYELHSISVTTLGSHQLTVPGSPMLLALIRAR